uniref:DUF4408 domain-containing protein n=1 Tax=Fagus sylvatica TaxID=28930 RepID=A0A2N9GPL6_FAGSY
MASMLSLKAVLISTSVVLMGLGLKASVPLVLKFFSASHMWASLLSWLKPPYLYVIINGIIITIAASSRFHHRTTTPSSTDGHHPDPILSPAEDNSTEFLDSTVVVVPEVKKEVVVLNGSAEVDEDEEEDDDFKEALNATWTPPKKRNESLEKPLVSARFSHRKPAKASPEGARALRVTKPKRHETLENTWKAITEGRAMPLTRHMKKSETWENHGREIHVDSLGPAVKKSETFRDKTNQAAAAVPLLRKEPSLSQDELNRRVEAFIKKFNEEMRLQREESLNQYKEMINLGTH